MAVFEAFARVSPLAIDLDTITKREPPEPDIRCVIAGNGEVAFELVEIVDKEMSRRLGIKIHLEAYLRNIYSATRSKALADASVTVIMKGDTSKLKRWKAAREILEQLLKRGPSFEGELGTPHVPECVKKVHVRRGYSGGPYFGVSDAGSFTDPTEKRIRSKLSKSYETNAPKELLAYYRFHVSNFGTVWQPCMADVVAGIDASAFRRVWIYDHANGSVCWVWPEL